MKKEGGEGMADVEVAGEVGTPKRTHNLTEWKECRATVARFDKIIADLRKYGFILLAALLTAKTYLFLEAIKSPAELGARFGVSLVTMLLIYALFVVDRYHEVMMRAALNRSSALEKELGMSLTWSVSMAAKNSGIDRWGLRLYMLFIAVSFVVSAVTYLALLTQVVNTFAFWPHGVFLLLSCALAVGTGYAVYDYDARTKRFLSHGDVMDRGNAKETM
jgi:hypothetical protein